MYIVDARLWRRNEEQQIDRIQMSEWSIDLPLLHRSTDGEIFYLLTQNPNSVYGNDYWQWQIEHFWRTAQFC